MERRWRCRSLLCRSRSHSLGGLVECRREASARLPAQSSAASLDAARNQRRLARSLAGFWVPSSRWVVRRAVFANRRGAVEMLGRPGQLGSRFRCRVSPCQNRQGALPQPNTRDCILRTRSHENASANEQFSKRLRPDGNRDCRRGERAMSEPRGETRSQLDRVRSAKPKLAHGISPRFRSAGVASTGRPLRHETK